MAKAKAMDKQKIKKKTDDARQDKGLVIDRKVQSTRKPVKKKVDWRGRWAIGLVVILGVVAGVCFLARPLVEQVVINNKYPDRGVPRMDIGLNGVSLEEVNGGEKDIKYEGNTVTVYDEQNKKTMFSNVRVKGRGNGTWLADKKPYQIKFANKVDMFGLGKAKKWVLLANALDATNLRTEIGFDLEQMLGMKPAFDGEFVELYFDGEYEGLYYLTHTVEIDKESVDLRDSLGVLVELDNLYWNGEKYYVTGNGDKLVLKDAVVDEMSEIAMSSFLHNYNEFEIAVAEKNYERINELVDVESFARYFLLSEFTVNPDAYWTSFFMYKNGNDDKIHAGPGWDFDYALANRAWENWMGEEFYSPTRSMVRKDEILSEEDFIEMGLTTSDDGIDWYTVGQMISQIMYDLMEIQEFQDLVCRVYIEQLQGRKGELESRIKVKAAAIESAVLNDEKKWGDRSFWQEINKLVAWISERYDYFDEVYGDMGMPVGDL